MFTVEEIIESYKPEFQFDQARNRVYVNFLKWFLREDDFANFAENYPHLKGIEFIEQALEYFNFSTVCSDRDLENIPSRGRVVIAANHPIGSLDGLSLLKLIHNIRPDVKIVANDLLHRIEPLREMILPVKNMGGKASKGQLISIISALEKEQALIFFPAGEVSRFGLSGIKDGTWHPGFIKIAEKTRSPILPVMIQGRNSAFFYISSIIWKPFSTALLIREMFRQKDHKITMKIGNLIPFSSFSGQKVSPECKAKLLKKHLYRLQKGKPPIFETLTPIAMPERRHELKKAIEAGEFLGETADSKKIFICDFKNSSPVMREISRLREIAFRAVDEGTGDRRDMDKFDQWYRHLLLWDEEDLEIVGAYRFTDAEKTTKERGTDGLYTGTLFNMKEEDCWFIKNGIELGRSFIQPRYWGRRGLDYLWMGIGAFLWKNPGYRYLFGPVSISGTMPVAAREILITFYRLYFGVDSPSPAVSPKNPINFHNPASEILKEFTGEDYRADLKKLKMLLSNMGVSIPPLYKQYSELCKPGGVRFLDFNVDPEFNNCIDGLVIMDLEYLKEKKKKRYMPMA